MCAHNRFRTIQFTPHKPDAHTPTTPHSNNAVLSSTRDSSRTHRTYNMYSIVYVYIFRHNIAAISLRCVRQARTYASKRANALGVKSWVIFACGVCRLCWWCGYVGGINGTRVCVCALCVRSLFAVARVTRTWMRERLYAGDGATRRGWISSVGRDMNT